MVDSLVSVVSNNIGVDSISASADIKDLTLGVDHVFALESEDLPPSRVGGVHPNVL